MTDHAHDRIHVAAPPARCFAFATDFTRYPRWAGDVKEVEVLACDAHGRATRVAYRVAALGRSIRYVLDYDYSEAPRAFSWTLHGSDQLRALDGRYQFHPDGDGTRVDYDLGLELAVPLPGLVKRQAAGRIVRTALGDLRRAVEADSPVARDPAPASAWGPTPRGAGPTSTAHPDAVPFEEVGREPRPLPAGDWLDALLHEVLGALPEVRDHAREAVDALLGLARSVLDAAEHAVADHREREA